MAQNAVNVMATPYWLVHDGTHQTQNIGDMTMLETIAIVLLILWVLGLVSSYTMGGFIHILLVAVVVVVLVRLLRGRSI